MGAVAERGAHRLILGEEGGRDCSHNHGFQRSAMTSGSANEVGFAWRMNCSKIEENRETPLPAKGFKTGGRTAGTLNKRTEAMLVYAAASWLCLAGRAVGSRWRGL